MQTWRATRKRALLSGFAAVAAIGLLAGCTSDGTEATGGDDAPADGGTADEGAPADSGSDSGSGDTVVIGWSGPAADHGWLGAINTGAINAAEQFDDVELRQAEAPTTSPSRSRRSSSLSTMASTRSLCCRATAHP